MASIPVAGAVTDQAPTQLPPPVAGKTVNAAVRAGKVRFRLPGHQRVRRAHRSAADADRDDLRHHRRPRDADLGQRHAGRHPARVVLRGHLQGRPDDGIASRSPTLALAGALPSCPKAQAARAGGQEAKTRQLWGDGKGAFRTSGQFSSATVRGTRWVVIRQLRRDADQVVRGRRHRPRLRAGTRTSSSGPGSSTWRAHRSELGLRLRRLPGRPHGG